jgi:4-amino-4-deoxy-L-arabinose transferase-like glycosyltransferase
MIRYLIITIAAAVLFLPFLGNVHLFDWDEINFAECAREMIVTNDYLRVQIDYLPFWEKPPFFIWLQALSMHLFGINEYAARFPNAVVGIITLLCLYYTGKKVANEKIAGWWTLLYAASWLPHFYFKSGIIDPTFNLFIFLAFYHVYMLGQDDTRKKLHSWLGGLFLGLAVLTKGPVALLVALLSFTAYVILNKGFWGYKSKYLLLVALSAILTTSIWFGVEIANHGIGLVADFIMYQVRLFQTEDAGHGGPFYYHFIILLIGCFPASVFLFQYNKRLKADKDPAKAFTKWMWVMFVVVLVLFSIVKTKIVHYSSLCYFPLTYLAALQLYRLNEKYTRIKSRVRIMLLVIGGLLAIAITALPLVGINKDKLIPNIQDPFAVANLQADVSWNYAEALWGLLYLVGIIVSVWLLKKQFRYGILTLCGLQLVIIQVTIIHFTPKIEAFSQRAAIEYFKSFRGKDVYVQVLGYKSYAHLFYTQKKPPYTPGEEQLLYGKIDKPAYFICKITEAERYKQLEQLQQIGEKNGFVFFKRK